MVPSLQCGYQLILSRGHMFETAFEAREAELSRSRRPVRMFLDVTVHTSLIETAPLHLGSAYTVLLVHSRRLGGSAGTE